MTRLRRSVVIGGSLLCLTITIGLLLRHTGTVDYNIPYADSLFKPEEPEKPHPFYKPEPEYLPPPIKDPFQSLVDTGKLPPIPEYNTPDLDLWKKHNLTVPPPLLIGFTRSWPMLLQAVTSYITAGWPPSQIHVVENTGTQQANNRGQLTLQNPFYLNHTTLKTLGVNIIQTPTLLTFAQLQNFYLSLTYANDWPFYFWSHMDVFALSHENGLDGSPKAGEEGYLSLYARAVEETGRTMQLQKEYEQSIIERVANSQDEISHEHKQRNNNNNNNNEKREEHEGKWAARFFAYDHLTLMNPKAVEDVGGWDSLIPYYITDCDMYTRFAMKGWVIRDRNAGIVTDTATALDDLRALYRDPDVEVGFTDPNPPMPKEEKEKDGDKEEKKKKRGEGDEVARSIEYWKRLAEVGDRMWHHKHGDRGRNTWQLGQHGGQDEPFYYDAAGIAEAIDILTEAGRNVYRKKWAKGDCDLIAGGGLKFEDMWKVREKNWLGTKRSEDERASR